MVSIKSNNVLSWSLKIGFHCIGCNTIVHLKNAWVIVIGVIGVILGGLDIFFIGLATDCNN